MSEKTIAAFRDMLRDEKFTAIPGAFDALSARLLEKLGFRAIYLPGNALSLQLGIGQSLLTLNETVDAARRISGQLAVPVVVDGGSGFGGPVQVYRAIRELAAAGVAAIHMDDQPYPKRASYHLGKNDVAPVSHLETKLRIAREALEGNGVALIARCDAWKATKSIDATIERLVKYVDAGADALMVLDLPIEHVAMVKAALPGTPLIWFCTPSDTPPSTAELAEAGFNLGLYPFHSTAATVSAIVDTWGDFAADGVPKQNARPILSSAKLTQEIIGMERYWKVEEDYTIAD